MDVSTRYRLTLLFISATLFQLAFGASANIVDRCLDADEVNYDEDYFPDKVVLEHSSHWSISYNNTFKIVTNTEPDVNTSYMLYQCGTDIPAEEKGKHHLYIEVPLQRGIALTSTTQIPHLELLGKRHLIKAYVGDSQYVSSPCLRFLIGQGEVQTLKTQEGMNETAFLDSVIKEIPDVLIIEDNSNFKDTNQTMIVSEHKESDPLTVFEWHKVYGALFNMEAEASKQFDESRDRYECTASNARSLVKETNSGKMPTVAWAFDYDGTFYVATCDPKFNYYCEFAEKCSANLLNTTSTETSMNIDDFVNFAMDADVWIYTGFTWSQSYQKYKEKLDQLPSVKNKAVYDVTRSGSNAWFEQRMIEFDLVLEDFCDVVKTINDCEVVHERKWFRDVFNEILVPFEECKAADIHVPLVSRASECTPVDKCDTSVSDASTGDAPIILVAFVSILAVLAS